jgi:hypothetical protein
VSGSKHALNWTTLLIAIPVGFVASLVTLAFRGVIDLINRLLFNSDSEITVAMHVWPWIFWPLLVGAGGVLAGYFLRFAVAIEKQETVKTDYLEVINARLDAVPPKPPCSVHCHQSPVSAAAPQSVKRGRWCSCRR